MCPVTVILLLALPLNFGGIGGTRQTADGWVVVASLDSTVDHYGRLLLRGGWTVCSA